MNFDESTINAVHQQTGFDQLYIEKVLRLLGILELFFSTPVLKDKYVLKGEILTLNKFINKAYSGDIKNMTKLALDLISESLEEVKKNG